MASAWLAVAASLAVTVPARLRTALLLPARLAAVSVIALRLSEVVMEASRLAASETLTGSLTLTLPLPMTGTPLRIDAVLVSVAPEATLMIRVPKLPVNVAL